MQGWPEPAAGDIAWCHFPDAIHARPKPRPALILTVQIDESEIFFVTVAFGTSQKLNRLYSGEFQIRQRDNPATYAMAGLSFDTKFDLKNVLTLPFNLDWFSVPPHAPHGQNPKLGTLHPSMVRVASTAFKANST
jgi:hypothetical protein